MPTLDDAPITPILVGGQDLTAGAATATTDLAKEDLIQIYDISARLSKTITVDELANALGLTLV